jgi:5'-nucleotidase
MVTMFSMTCRRALAAATISVLALTGAACSSDDGGETAASVESTSTTVAQQETLTILVSNDDGVDSEGLDLLVEALATIPNVELTVVAPATNQSGTSDKTTPGGVTSAASTTASGVEAVAVDGFPADAVRVALDELDLDPDLVVSGINEGQNVGPLAGLSGTVGVARTAVRDGIPAVAVSGGLAYDTDQFAVGANLVVMWIEENRQALVDRTMPVEVVSFNIPACDVGDMGEVVDVELATEIPEGANVFESACDPSGPPPADDVLAIMAGFPSRTVVPADIESITPG